MCFDWCIRIWLIAGLVFLSVAFPASAAEDASCEPEQPRTAEARLPATTDRVASLRKALDRARASVIEAGDSGRALTAARNRFADFETDVGADLVHARIHFARTLDLLATRLREGRDADATSILAIESEAEALLQRAAGDDSMLVGASWRSHAFGYQAEIAWRQKRLGAALSLNDRAVRDALLADDRDLLARWTTQTGRLRRAMGQPAAAISAYRQARRLLEELRSGMAVGEFLSRARETHLELADLLLLESVALPDQRQALLREAQGALEDIKAAELRDYFDDPCLEALKVVEASEIPQAVVLYPVLLSDRMDLLVGSGGRLIRIPVTASPSEIERETIRFTSLVQDPTSGRYRKASSNLHRWLIAPLEEFLKETGRTLVFVPSGVFLRLPLAAIRLPGSEQFLIETIPIAVTPGLRLADPQPMNLDRAKILVAGLSEPEEGFPALPEVPREMTAAARLFPHVQILDAEFTRSGFETAFDSQPFSIVHIASHGQFSGDARGSFLLAHDGRLYLDDLSEIVARARFRAERPLELLTLSACETAAGDERAVLGLAGLAVQAGARSALATLWRVDDIATRRLIEVFYKELSKPGVSRSVALQRAQIALISDSEFSHPNFWAPFLMINNWL